MSPLRVVLDVQHVFRPAHPGDRGSVFRTARGTRIAEADLALGYSAAARRALELVGAVVVSNQPFGMFVGPYSRRAADAAIWGANVYVACHVNAGGGRYVRCSAPAGRLGSERLARELGQHIAAEFPAVLSRFDVVPLVRRDRGWPCCGLVQPPCATVLLEPFFGDNPRHLAAIGSPLGLERLGAAIASAVVRWRKLTP